VNKIDLALFLEIHQHMRGRVRYQWAAKAAHLTEDSARIDVLDCSGYVQYQLARQGIHVPSGSVEITDWMKRHAPQARASDTGLLLRAWPPSTSGPGHIYFTFEGRTYECARALKGVGNQSLPRYQNHPNALAWLLA